MCGIIGIVGKEGVAGHLVDGLKRLEYRGYDSAGIAVINPNGEIIKLREEGKISNLEASLETNPLEGVTGIGHTRWATHGVPSKKNAHPHSTGKVALVHNGIIENFQELKAELAAAGHEFKSDTDSEVIAVLIHSLLESGLEQNKTVIEAVKRLRGAYAIAVIFSGEEDLMIGARKGSPLAIGYGDGEMYLGSDSIALAPLTNKISYLEEGDIVTLGRDSAEFTDKDGNLASREIKISNISSASIGKAGYRHYMLKEIYEQPTAVAETLHSYINPASGGIELPQNKLDFKSINRVIIVACGTSYYAGSVASYWFEQISKLPCEVQIASEFRYRQPVLDKNTLAVFISQSGETADTLAALRLCKSEGLQCAALVNSHESTMAFESDLMLRTYAGPEIGVASTKAFTTQLVALACLAIFVAKKKGMVTVESEKKILHSLLEIPAKLSEVLMLESEIQEISNKLALAQDIIYIGRGVMFPIAMEGALKLKEISYIHAEGFAAGELKHGPIALIDEKVPVIALAPHDELSEKTASNIQEVAARKGCVVLIGSHESTKSLSGITSHVIEVPDGDIISNPVICAVPVQLLAYHIAVNKGTDVDQPRNLAKSVTVE